MSSGEWRPFCLGLNVLTQGYDANKGDLKGENLLIIIIETWNISSKNWQNYLYMKYCHIGSICEMLRENESSLEI